MRILIIGRAKIESIFDEEAENFLRWETGLLFGSGKHQITVLSNVTSYPTNNVITVKSETVEESYTYKKELSYIDTFDMIPYDFDFIRDHSRYFVLQQRAADKETPYLAQIYRENDMMLKSVKNKIATFKSQASFVLDREQWINHIMFLYHQIRSGHSW